MKNKPHESPSCQCSVCWKYTAEITPGVPTRTQFLGTVHAYMQKYVDKLEGLNSPSKSFAVFHYPALTVPYPKTTYTDGI